MHLQGRNLSLGMQGDDIQLLISELSLIGFAGVSPSAEAPTFSDYIRQAVLAFQEANGLAATGVVDETTARTIKVRVDEQPFRMAYVRIRHTDGTLLAGMVVRAYDRNAGQDDLLLQEAVTGAYGICEIVYHTSAFNFGEKGRADLVLKVFGGAEEALFVSEVRFRAEAVEIFEVSMQQEAFRGASAYEQIMDQLSGLLNGVALESLGENDIDYLAGKTGIGRQQISQVVDNARLAGEMSLQPEVLYAFSQAGLSIQNGGLLTLQREALGAALDTAVQQNLVPGWVHDQRDQIIAEQVTGIQVQQLLRPASAGQPASLGDLLNTLQLDPGRQQAFARIYSQKSDTEPGFWEAVRAQPEFQNETAVRRIQVTLELGTLTNNHLPLVQELQQQVGEELATGGLQRLAAFTEADWKETVAAAGVPEGMPGDKPEDRINTYAGFLQQAIESRFPTTTFRYRLVQDDAANNPFQEMKADFQRFFEQNAEFEFGRIPVDEYLNEGREQKLDGIHQPEVFVKRLKEVGRVFKITPKYSQIRALLSDGLHSAQSMVAIRRASFVEGYRQLFGSEKEAETAYDKAVQIFNLALMLYARHGTAFRSPLPYVIAGNPAEAPEASPEWRALFGSLDLCDCKHCQSIYSPAAYFVDILRFLKDSPSENGKTPLQVLLARRPGLEHIELTCENTHTEIPYVDLVNEVLEEAVAPSNPKIAWQAHGSASSLSVHPEYINTAAYQALATSGSHPSLPFNLWVEETRAYLQHLGVPRHVLLETFYPGASSDALADKAIVREQLGLTATEAEIITGASAQAAPPSMGTDVLVEVFLQRTGLRYLELLELLGACFINPYEPGDYLYTTSAFEKASVLSNLGFQDEGIAGYVFEQQQTGTVPLYRFYFQGAGLHFYTAFETEKNALNPNDLEGVAGYVFDAPMPGRIPLHRMVHPKTGGHFYTTSESERNLAISRFGYQIEGIACYIHPTQIPGSIPLYRLADPSVGKSRKLSLVAIDKDAKGKPVDPATCDLSKIRIRGFDSTTEEKTNRFLRLQRKLGLSIREMDKIITAFQATDLGDSLLRNLSFMKRLEERLDVPFTNMSGWWNELDTTIYYDHQSEGQPEIPSSYEQLFLNQAVQHPVDEAFELSEPLRGELKDATATIDEHVPPILAALRIAAADLSDIRKDSRLDDPLETLDLSKLSHFYRIASLAKALHLNIGDFLTLQSLSGMNPFEKPESTWRFVEMAQKVRQSEFSISQLSFLFLPQGHESSSVAWPRSNVLQLAKTIHEELRKIADVFRVPDHLTGEFVRKHLGALLKEEMVDQAAQMIEGTAVYATLLPNLPEAIARKNSQGQLIGIDKDKLPALIQNKLGYELQSGRLSFRGAMSQLEMQACSALLEELGLPVDSDFGKAIKDIYEQPASFIEAYFSSFLKHVDKEEAEDKLIREFSSLDEQGQPFWVDRDGVSTTDHKTAVATAITIKYNFLLNHLLPHLRNISSKRYVCQALSEALPLDLKAVGFLLSEVLKSPNDLQALLQEDIFNLVDNEPGGKQLNTSYFDLDVIKDPTSSSKLDLILLKRIHDFEHSFLRMQKSALIITRFSINEKELAYLSNPDPANQGSPVFDFNQLPVLPTEGVPGLFGPWERLYDICTFRDNFSPGAVDLAEVLSPATADDQREGLLRSFTGWDLADVQELKAQLGLMDSDLNNEQWLLRFHACQALAGRLGISVKQLFSWAGTEPDEKQAQAVKNAVKAKYDDQKWLEVAKPLRDALREKQRAALVAYHLAKKGLRDPNDLFDDFLLDMEMSPCMMTSRIKQAIGSVQIFIQRCLMNLEPGVSLNPKDAREWSQWRKQYRVWEANRKIFLYPENWIEPELRDDKSPFFRELESELLQNELTAETAETAYLKYLEKLNQISFLEPAGLYSESDASNQTSVDRLHIFGRTSNTSHQYFYTKFEKNLWAPWEKVDLDIEGDHLLPLVWNGRLYLFWPIFAKKTSQVSTQQQSDPETYWEIKLAYSEYRQSKWSAKKILEAPLLHPDLPGRKATEMFSFLGTLTTPEKLVIQCYGLNKTETVTSLSTETKIIRKEETFQVAGSYVSISGFAYDSENNNEGIPNIAITITQLETHSRLEGNTYVVKPEFKIRAKTFTGNDGSYNFPVLNLTGAITINAEAPSSFQTTTISKNLPVESGRGYWKHFEFKKELAAKPAPPPIVNFKLQPIGHFSLTASDRHQAVPALGSYEPSSPKGTRREGMWYVEDKGRQEEALYLGFIDPTGAALPIFKRTPHPFRIMPTHQFYISGSHWFFQDENYICLISTAKPPKRGLLIQNFSYPWILEWIKRVKIAGINHLLAIESQALFDSVPIIIDGNIKIIDRKVSDEYWPAIEGIVNPNELPDGLIDFGHSQLFGQYNWELFFHIPFLIAVKLSKNQRFEEAQQWFHYLFDPTSSRPGTAERFWNIRPFYEEAKKGVLTLEELMEEAKILEQQVQQWEERPFNPHAIARLRTVAYMKAVVMKYIENLIEWGDQLFRRDTIESINEATQLYILAAQILGRRPESIPPRAVPEVQSFHSLITGGTPANALGNALVEIEKFIFPSGSSAAAFSGSTAALGSIWLFCLPKNNKLLSYWSAVAGRLFKIRHCMNIEGVVRQLPLFEPPIDPALLVRAAAAGIRISDVLNEMNAPLPHYRFSFMVQKALELCNDLKALSGALLSALEKRDAEAMALLRSSQEIKLLNVVCLIKEQQVKESKETLVSLHQSKAIAETRFTYYKDIEYLIAEEQAHLTNMESAAMIRSESSYHQRLAQGATLIPNFTTGTEITFSIGGPAVAAGFTAFSLYKSEISAQYADYATRSLTIGGYKRRAKDWDLQKRLAETEIKQIDKQILAAEIRVAIAEQELKNHELQIENAKEVDVFMRDKYTNLDLYDWMASQLSGVYFQSYQMAFDLAKRAERAYAFELGLDPPNFIQFGYWDSLKKGLLAGEKLHHDLKRMELAYLDQNRREYELTKHISILQLDPLALVQLRTTGKCNVSLPEELFDMDCPGHYLRRIKSVALSIPCVTGPYTSVNCTLTLLKSVMRKNASLKNDTYKLEVGEEDDRYIQQYGAIQSIVTSSAQNDGGLFETNLRDERYLPFEGAGAISEWRLELPPADLQQFNYDTIADVILHLRYTAREGGSHFRDRAIQYLDTWIGKAQTAGTARLFSVRHEFPLAWTKLKNDTDGNLLIQFKKDHFPFWLRNKLETINEIHFLVKMPDSTELTQLELTKTIQEKDDTQTVKIGHISPNGLGPIWSGEISQIPLPKFNEPFSLNFSNNDFEELWVLIKRGIK